MQMLRAARALKFFSIALPRPDDFLARTHGFYTDARCVADLVEKSQRGLAPYEASLLDKFAPCAGVALVLGCGAGREAIALAKRGWQVVGLDVVPALIDAASANAVRAGVRVDWHCQDMTRGFVVDRSFDLACLFGYVYNLIPDRQRRVRLLSACRQHLNDDGVCLLNFAQGPPASDRERRAHRWRRRLARLAGGNRECQLGDHWWGDRLFVHVFATVDELIEEAAEAGFHLELHSDGTHAILRPVASRPLLSNVKRQAPAAARPVERPVEKEKARWEE